MFNRSDLVLGWLYFILVTLFILWNRFAWMVGLPGTKIYFTLYYPVQMYCKSLIIRSLMYKCFACFSLAVFHIDHEFKTFANDDTGTAGFYPSMPRACKEWFMIHPAPDGKTKTILNSFCEVWQEQKESLLCFW